MSQILTFENFEVDYDVSFPNISIEVYFVAPKLLGGKRYDLGGGSLSVQNPSFTIPVSLGPLSGSITLSLKPPQMCIGGSISFDALVHTYHFPIGTVCFNYTSPVVLAEPPWSVHPAIIDQASLQKRINNSHRKSGSGATHITNDPTTQAIMRGLFEFVGLGDFVGKMIAQAQNLVGYQKMARLASEGAKLDAATPASDREGGELLIAFAAGPELGALVGLSGLFGLYFTSNSDYGMFGSMAAEVGLVYEISLNVVWIFFWADAGQSPKQNFAGNNGVIGINAGELMTGSLAVCWPEDEAQNLLSATPCGFAAGAGIGGGLPVNFYVANSTTWTKVTAPSNA